MIYVLLICLALKIGLTFCLTCTDIVTSAACPIPNCRWWSKLKTIFFAGKSQSYDSSIDDGSTNSNSEKNSIQYDNYIISDVIGFQNRTETLSEAEKGAQICVCSSKEKKKASKNRTRVE